MKQAANSEMFHLFTGTTATQKPSSPYQEHSTRYGTTKQSPNTYKVDSTLSYIEKPIHHDIAI